MGRNPFERFARWLRRREPRYAVANAGAVPPDDALLAEVARRAGLRTSQLKSSRAS